MSSGELARSRPSVAFRLVLALPHLFWASAYGMAAVAAAVVGWFMILGTRRVRPDVHWFVAGYIRYVTRVGAYLFLAAQPYPPFLPTGTYPVDVEIAPPAEERNRWTAGFRIVLAIPAILVASSLFGSGGARGGGVTISVGVAAAAAFLAWFACLVRGRMPQGFQDLVVYALTYSARVDAYVLLLTDAYPDSDPFKAPATRDRRHPVRLAVRDDRRRTRLTVGFRLLLALPHLLWLLVWGIATYLVAIVNWIVTLIAGHPARPIHRFLAAYVRYQAHVVSYIALLANPFPGFTGRPGSYPVEVRLDADPTAPQNRWKTGFRLILGLPAWVLGSAYGNVIGTVAFLGWFASLFTGEMPRGLRNLGAASVAYTAQTYSYLYLLTDVYPFGGPTANVDFPEG